MDSSRPAIQMYALFGAITRPKRNHVWACLLLDLYSGLGQGEGPVSSLQTSHSAAEGFTFEKLKRDWLKGPGLYSSIPNSHNDTSANHHQLKSKQLPGHSPFSETKAQGYVDVPIIRPSMLPRRTKEHKVDTGIATREEQSQAKVSIWPPLTSGSHSSHQ